MYRHIFRIYESLSTLHFVCEWMNEWIFNSFICGECPFMNMTVDVKINGLNQFTMIKNINKHILPDNKNTFWFKDSMTSLSQDFTRCHNTKKNIKHMMCFWNPQSRKKIFYHILKKHGLTFCPDWTKAILMNFHWFRLLTCNYNMWNMIYL